MGQIRWPIFLFFMYMLVLTEKTSIFPKSNMFWILVFSCPKMTFITIFTRMTLILQSFGETPVPYPQLNYLFTTPNGKYAVNDFNDDNHNNDYDHNDDDNHKR